MEENKTNETPNREEHAKRENANKNVKGEARENREPNRRRFKPRQSKTDEANGTEKPRNQRPQNQNRTQNQNHRQDNDQNLHCLIYLRSFSSNRSPHSGQNFGG